MKDARELALDLWRTFCRHPDLQEAVSNLLPVETRQLSFDDDAAGWDRATQAVDEVRSRFGPAAIGPAVLAGADGIAVKREGDTQSGPREPGSGSAERGG